ncbi:hypothetical protein BDZ89DRAFT_1079917 [Hymenopellis radicata]|nr:hypothetical protein BDZ89DRAFT_1079917 [Hymenopellis radicata]
MSRLFLSLARMLHQHIATTGRQLVVASAEDVNRQRYSSCLGLFPFGSSSIDDLPNEVLQIIFSNLPAVTYVFYAGVGFRPKKEGSSKLGTPAHVCHRWRTIMHSVPFALRLVIGNVDASRAPALFPLMGDLECLLKEWDKAPFDLELGRWGMPVPRIHRPASPALLQLILRLLFERAAQWRSITIDRISCLDALHPLLGEPLRLPHLEHIHLDFGDDVGAVDAVKHISSLHVFAAAARLRAAHLALYSHDLLPELPWNQLTYLTVKLDNITNDMDPVQLPPSICRVLRLSTQLTHLRLLPDFYGASDRWQHSSRIEYVIPSSIRHLTVGRATLLDILIGPSVTTLHVTPLGPPRAPPSTMSLAPILNFMRRSKCDALGRLVILGILPQDSGPHLRDLFHETRQLSELELMFTPLPGALHYEVLDVIYPLYSPSLTTIVLRTFGNFDDSRKSKVDLDDSFHGHGSGKVLHDFIETILKDVFVFIERRRQTAIRRRSTSQLRSIQVHVGVRLSCFDSQVSSTLDLSDTEVFRSLKDFADHPCTPKLRLVVQFSCSSPRLFKTDCSVKHAGPCESVDYDILQ